MGIAIDNMRYVLAKKPSMRSMGIALSLAALLFPVVTLGAPDDCTALRDAYRAAVPAAQVCNAKVAKSCAATRPVALDDVCRCQVSVNPERTRELDRLVAAYEAKGCSPRTGVCNRMCALPVSTCVGGATGAPSVCGRPR